MLQKGSRTNISELPQKQGISPVSLFSCNVLFQFLVDFANRSMSKQWTIRNMSLIFHQKQRIYTLPLQRNFSSSSPRFPTIFTAIKHSSFHFYSNEREAVNTYWCPFLSIFQNHEVCIIIQRPEELFCVHNCAIFLQNQSNYSSSYNKGI